MNDLRKNAEAPPAPGSGPLGGNSPVIQQSPAAAVRHVEIDENTAGQRLDNLLARLLKGVPRSHIYQLVRSGQVRVNGARIEPLHKLMIGDRVRIPPVRISEGAHRPAPAAEFPVIHEDEHLLVINKPAGVAVHGGSGVSSGVIEQLRASRPQQKFLELVHRIDRDTSGLLMLAKKRATLVHLQAALRERSVEKTYLAIVLGRVPKRTKTLRHSLEARITREGERRVAVADGGQAAITHLLGLEHLTLPNGDSASLVSCRIETGRMHQIRVHLAFAGFPIIGDQKYGDFELNKLLYKLSLKRMYLHAFEIEIPYPGESDALKLQAPMPDEFRRLLAPGRVRPQAASRTPLQPT